LVSSSRAKTASNYTKNLMPVVDSNTWKVDTTAQKLEDKSMGGHRPLD